MGLQTDDISPVSDTIPHILAGLSKDQIDNDRTQLVVVGVSGVERLQDPAA